MQVSNQRELEKKTKDELLKEIERLHRENLRLKKSEERYRSLVDTDITEQKRVFEEKLKKSYDQMVVLKEKAEAANRLKSQFLSYMSHDIRTPLHGIMGFTHLLLKRERRTEEREYLEKTKILGEGLLNLINDILDFSKIEVGQLNIYQRPFALMELMESLGSIFEIQFDRKSVNFKIKILKDVPLVVCNDKWRISQVLANLTANALKYTTRGSATIRVSYKKSADMLVFKVKDTGVGIPGKYLKQIFDPFSQVQLADDFERKGTGLGLAIGKNLITLMGGTIEVHSQPGKGSEFIVEIPANSNKIKGETIVAELQVVPEMEIEDKKNNTILVAEDNTISRELILDQFNEAGFFSILLATNGKEAVDMALKHLPDLILMDIRMPVMDGNTAIAQLKKKGYCGPIIILSALAMREDINKSLQAGAVGYITKPIDFNKFLLQIGKFLKVKVGKGKVKEMDRGSGYQYQLKSESARGYEYKINDGISEKVRNIFLTDVREKLGIISGILETGDFENKKGMVNTIAHGYMGNAVYLGLSVLEASAKELGQAFKDNAPSQTLINQTMELAAILKRIIEENTNGSQSVIPG